MLPYNTEIWKILERRVKKRDMEGFYGGVFSPDKTKFSAFSYMRLNPAKADDYAQRFEGSHGATGVDLEKTKVYLDTGGYQSKSVMDCIREGVYQAYAISFFGAWWEGEWFILDGVIFFGEKMDEEAAKSYLSEYVKVPDYWTTMNFTVGLEGEEFPEAPFLVSWIKTRQKMNVHLAYIEYINVSLVDPLLRQLRIGKFEEYVEYGSTPWGQTLLYPAHKKFFLMVTLARHQEWGWRLVWFFYDTAAAKFYRWTYPVPRYSGLRHWYGEDIIEDIRDIAGWDDYALLNSSRTLDNPTFWSEYVLKRVDNRYQWLAEV